MILAVEHILAVFGLVSHDFAIVRRRADDFVVFDGFGKRLKMRSVVLGDPVGATLEQQKSAPSPAKKEMYCSAVAIFFGGHTCDSRLVSHV